MLTRWGRISAFIIYWRIRVMVGLPFTYDTRHFHMIFHLANLSELQVYVKMPVQHWGSISKGRGFWLAFLGSELVPLLACSGFSFIMYLVSCLVRLNFNIWSRSCNHTCGQCMVRRKIFHKDVVAHPLHDMLKINIGTSRLFCMDVGWSYG